MVSKTVLPMMTGDQRWMWEIWFATPSSVWKGYFDNGYTLWEAVSQEASYAN